MTELKPPTKPIPDWQSARDAWVHDVEGLVTEVDGWCRAEGWATRIIPRRLRDNQLGEHVVPALLLQVEFAQLMLEPVSPNVPGSDGLVELYLMPRYDTIARVYREHGDWRTYAGPDWNRTDDFSTTGNVPLQHGLFVWIVTRMVEDARQRAV